MTNNVNVAGLSKTGFLFSVAAAFFGSLFLANDTFVMHRIILCNDKFTAVSAYLVLGAWVGTFYTLLCGLALGKWFDKKYPGFSFGSKKMQLFAIISGTISAGSTIFCLVGNQNLDSSLVTSLSNVAILYVATYDALCKRVAMKDVLIPIAMVLVGAFLASTTKLSGGLEVSLIGIVVLVFGRCATDATDQVVKQRGVWRSDAVTFAFWRMFWLAVSGTVIVITIAHIRGTYGQLSNLLNEVVASPIAWFFVFLTMFFVFFFQVFLHRAMQTSAVSMIAIIISAQIVFGIPLLILIDYFQPGVLGQTPNNATAWICRISGAAIIVTGIFCLNRNNAKRSRN